MTGPAGTHASAAIAVTVVAAIDLPSLVGTLRAHRVPGVEELVEDEAVTTVRRLVDLGDGPEPVTAALSADGVRVVATSRGATAGSPSGSPDPAAKAPADSTEHAAQALRRLADHWFGLADDLVAVAEAFAPDPVLGPLVAARPALRVAGHPDPFEAAAQTVLGQQVSLAAARTFTGRLAAAFGDAGPDGLVAFPSPVRLAAAGSEAIRVAVRVPAARARTLHALAAACADGLRLDPDGDHARTRAGLLALPGIGPWTVDYLTLRVLGDRDAFPAGDLVLRRALGLPDARAVALAGQRWTPWQAFAAQHLWAAASHVQPPA